MAEAQWALTGLGLALLVLLVLPSDQIKLGAKQLHGLIGSYSGHYWQVTYSAQGTTSWTSRGPGGGSQAWKSTSNGDSINTSGLDAKCVGTITPTLTWVPTTGQTSTTDPPPTQVIVTESGYAYYNGGGANNGPGTLSDGWSADTPPNSPNNIYGPHYYYSASGTHYEVKDGTSGTITLSAFSLNGSTPTVTNPNVGNDTVAVSVSLNVSAASVTINPVGAIQDSNGKYNILVGQVFKPTLPGVSPSNTTYSWSVSGVTFQSWTASTSSAVLASGSGPLNNSTPQWVWNDPSPTTETVTCTATVTPNDGKNAPYTVNATQKILVQLPTWKAGGRGGYMQVNNYHPDNPSNTIYRLWAGPAADEKAANVPVGMVWQASVYTPATPAFGTGNLEIIQIVTPNDNYTTYAAPQQNRTDPLNNITGLDKTYPYGVVVPETQQPLVDDDNPGLSLTTQSGSIIAASANFNSKFVDYLMYQPPGADSQWIALAQFSWSTNGTATIPTTNNWADYVTQNGSDSAGTVTHNTWTSFTGVVGPDFFPSWTCDDISGAY